MKVVVFKSQRRRKTASAQVRNGSLYIQLPGSLSPFHAQKVIDKFKRRFQGRSRAPSDRDLVKRVQRLNKKYFQGKLNIKSIAWSKNQRSLFGSCSLKKGAIRISAKLARVPIWVQDAIIMHELTHLVIHRHGKNFWQIANQYPLMERARGYLLALSRQA